MCYDAIIDHIDWWLSLLVAYILCRELVVILCCKLCSPVYAVYAVSFRRGSDMVTSSDLKWFDVTWCKLGWLISLQFVRWRRDSNKVHCWLTISPYRLKCCLPCDKLYYLRDCASCCRCVVSYFVIIFVKCMVILLSIL